MLLIVYGGLRLIKQVLRIIGTDRLFSVKFDLTKEVETPSAPWGSEN